MAPFTPFIAESLWQRVTGFNFQDQNKSVHLERWTVSSDLTKNDEEVLVKMEAVRRIVELGLAKRDEAGIKIRQMLSSVSVSELPLHLNEEYEELIREELNVQSLIWTAPTEGVSVELDTTITPELQQEGWKRELVRLINNRRKDLNLNLADRTKVIIGGADETLRDLIGARGEEIKAATLSLELELSEVSSASEVTIDNHKFSLGIEIIIN